MTTDTFSITASGNDGIVQKQGNTTYPPDGSTAFFAATTQTEIQILKGKSGTLFSILTGHLKFDTSSLPDNAIISSAVLRLRMGLTNTFDGGREFVAEYHDFGAAIDTTDWTSTVSNNAHAGTAIGSITDNAVSDFELQNLENINKSGDTGFRLHISGGEPTLDNYVFIATFDHASLPEPQLLVTYTVPTGGIQTRANVGTATGMGTSITVNKPTDAEEGDILYAAISSHQTTSTVPISAPDGTWTKHVEVEGESAGGQTLAVFEKLAGPSEPSSYTFTQVSATAEYASVATAVYHEDGLPLETYGVDSGDDLTGPAITTDSLTTLDDDDLVISFYGQDQTATGDFDISSPAALVEVGQVWGGTHSEGTAIFKELREAAGAGAHEVTVAAGTTSHGACWAILAVGTDESLTPTMFDIHIMARGWF